jgi:hypothetical protein
MLRTSKRSSSAFTRRTGTYSVLSLVLWRTNNSFCRSGLVAAVSCHLHLYYQSCMKNREVTNADQRCQQRCWWLDSSKQWMSPVLGLFGLTSYCKKLLLINVLREPVRRGSGACCDIYEAGLARMKHEWRLVCCSTRRGSWLTCACASSASK